MTEASTIQGSCSNYKLNTAFKKLNHLDATILSVQREAIYSFEGQKIPQDKLAVQCVILKNTTGKYFGVKCVEQPQDNTIAVAVNEQTYVYVKIEEVVGRWQLDKHKVVKYSDGRLDECLINQKTAAILNNYQRICEKQSKNTTPYALEPNLLMKVIKTAFLAYRKIFKNVNHKYVIALKELSQVHDLVVGFREDKLCICQMQAAQIIAQGGEAYIFQVPNISGKSKVLKQYKALDAFYPSWNEAQVLCDLHEGYKDQFENVTYIPGIQKPIYIVFDVHTRRAGSLQHQYDGDLKMALGFTDQDDVPSKTDWFGHFKYKLLAYFKFLTGFHYAVKQKGLIHGDIKPANIFVSGRGKHIHLFLGDFSSAVCYQQPDEFRDFDRYLTKKYMLLKEMKLRKSLHKSICQLGSSISSNDPCWIDYLKNGKQADIFALGCVLALLVVPGIAYMDYDGKYPKPDSFKKEALIQAKIPNALCDLIGEMLQADTTKRPDIDQVLQAFKELCKPLLYEPYDKMLSALKAEKTSASVCMNKVQAPVEIAAKSYSLASFNEAKNNYLIKIFPRLKLVDEANAWPMIKVWAPSYSVLGLKAFVVPEKALSAIPVLKNLLYKQSKTESFQKVYDPESMAYMLLWALKHTGCTHENDYKLLESTKLEVVEDLVQLASFDNIQEVLEACRNYLELFEPSQEDRLKYFCICCCLNSLKGCNKIFNSIADQLSFKKCINLLIQLNHVVSQYPGANKFFEKFIRKKIIGFINVWDSDVKFEALCSGLLTLNPTLYWLFLPGMRVPIRPRLCQHTYNPRLPMANLLKAFFECLRANRLPLMDREMSLISNAYGSKYPDIELLMQGLHALYQNSWKVAVEHFDKALKATTKRAILIYILKGICYYEQTKYSEALKEIAQVLSIFPQEHWGLAIRGACYFMLGNKELALTDFNQIIELTTKDTMVWTYLGHHALHNDQWEQAIQYYSQAIKQKIFYSDAHLYRGYSYLMGRSFENATDCIKKALKDFSKVIKGHPNEKLAWSLRGECYLLLREYELALTDLNQAIKLGAEHHLDFFNRSMCYQALNDRALSEKDNQQAEQLARVQENFSRLPFAKLPFMC